MQEVYSVLEKEFVFLRLVIWSRLYWKNLKNHNILFIQMVTRYIGIWGTFYWWSWTNKAIAVYVSKCQKLSTSEVPKVSVFTLENVYSWVEVRNDSHKFYVGITYDLGEVWYDLIWFIVDRFTKSIHFIPINVLQLSTGGQDLCPGNSKVVGNAPFYHFRR